VADFDTTAENGDFSFSHDLPEMEAADEVAPAPPPLKPRREEPAARERRASAPEPVEAASAVKPRRNLLSSSSSRKERDRAQVRMMDPPKIDLGPPPLPELSEAPPPAFEDAWPRQERSRAPDAPPAQRRGNGNRGRGSSTQTEPVAAVDRYPSTARNEDPPGVTILRSGTVDGMAYSLFSDGSIEAEMPEGLMRFASIDELRTHLDLRH
jgi:hypothetical protein